MTDITLLGHSGIELEKDGAHLVIDPGVFSDRSGLAAAGAALITHGHADHLAPNAFDGLDVDIYAPEDVVAQLAESGVEASRLHAVGPGEGFTAAGFDVIVLGGEHAEIYPGLPGARNNAYLIDGVVLAPGDSFTTAPDPAAVSVLFTPVAAPWLRLADAIDFAKAHPHATIVPVHDAVLSAGGIMLTDNIAGAVLAGRDYRRLQPNEVFAI